MAIIAAFRGVSIAPGVEGRRVGFGGGELVSRAVQQRPEGGSTADVVLQRTKCCGQFHPSSVGCYQACRAEKGCQGSGFSMTGKDADLVTEQRLARLLGCGRMAISVRARCRKRVRGVVREQVNKIMLKVHQVCTPR